MALQVGGSVSKKKADVDQFIKDAQAQRADQRYGELRGRRAQELEHWKQWDQSGRQPEHLEPLLSSINPLIKSEARKRMQGLGGSISPAALHQELRNAALRQIETFDPSRGAQLSTHIVGGLRRITDFIAANRNPKYMVKSDVERYGQYQNAINEFQETHGREPTVNELAKATGWKPKDVKKMHRGFGPEAFTDMGTDLEHDTQTEDPVQRVRSAYLLMQSQLKPEEQQFANLHYPEEGEQQRSVSAIAKAMGIPSHKAYRIKRRVESVLAPVIKRQ